MISSLYGHIGYISGAGLEKLKDLPPRFDECRYMIKTLVMLCCVLAMTVSAEARSLRVGMVEWVAFSPLNVAKAKDFWPGLDVTVTVFDANNALNEALKSGQVDIALDMMGSWLGLEQAGVPLVLLGETDWSNGGDKIIIRKGVKPEELHVVGVYLAQPSVLFFVNEYLRANKMEYSDVRFVEQDPAVLTEKFLEGKLSAIVNYDPQALKAEAGGGVVVATSATYEGCIPEGFVSLTSVYEKIPSEDWITFFKGWHRAVKWSKDSANWVEYQTILCRDTFRGTHYSEAELKGMLSSVKVFSAPEVMARNVRGGAVDQYLDRMKVFMRKMGVLKHPYTAEGLYKVQYFTEAAKGL